MVRRVRPGAGVVALVLCEAVALGLVFGQEARDVPAVVQQFLEPEEPHMTSARPMD